MRRPRDASSDRTNRSPSMARSAADDDDDSTLFEGPQYATITSCSRPRSAHSKDCRASRLSPTFTPRELQALRRTGARQIRAFAFSLSFRCPRIDGGRAGPFSPISREMREGPTLPPVSQSKGKGVGAMNEAAATRVTGMPLSPNARCR